MQVKCDVGFRWPNIKVEDKNRFEALRRRSGSHFEMETWTSQLSPLSSFNLHSSARHHKISFTLPRTSRQHESCQPSCRKTYPNRSPSTATRVAAKQQKNAPSHHEANNPHNWKHSSQTQTSQSISLHPLPTNPQHYHQRS